MSEKKTRTLDQIQQEYQNLCLKSGHMQYQIEALSVDLDMVNKEMRDLNFEAAAAKKAEAEQKAQAPAAAPAEQAQQQPQEA